MADFAPRTYGRRTAAKIEAVCRYLDWKFDWVISWDPTGAHARIPIMCKKKVWRGDFKDWCKLEKEPYCSSSLFYHVWDNYFDHVYMSDLRRYRQCDLCRECNIQMKIAMQKKDESLMRAIFLLKTVHLEHVRNLRRVVKSFEKIVKCHPEFLMMFGDRADSHKFAMPSFIRGLNLIYALFFLYV